MFFFRLPYNDSKIANLLSQAERLKTFEIFSAFYSSKQDFYYLRHLSNIWGLFLLYIISHEFNISDENFYLNHIKTLNNMLHVVILFAFAFTRPFYGNVRIIHK